ncbi:MAG: hypothetical protein V1847_03685 [Candidatus Diapherotrites archaeon]
MKYSSIAWVVAFVLLAGFVSQTVSAVGVQQGSMHSNDYYVVSFDGEGDAVVSAKLILVNNSDSNLSKVNLEIEGTAKVYKAVQESAGNYGYGCSYGEACPLTSMEKPSPPYWEPFAEQIDAKISYTSTATLLELPLPQEIEPNQSTAVVLLYKVSRYAEKDSLGVFKADFKTVIDRDAILVQNIRVALSAPQDWSVKGGTAAVNYRQDIFGAGALSSVASASIKSPEYQDYSNNISYAGGQVVKTAQNLDPLESFHVKMDYAESGWALNFWEIITTVIIAIAALGIGVWAWGKRKKNAPAKRGEGMDLGVFAQAALQAVGIIALWEIVFLVLSNGYQWFGSMYYSLSMVMVLLALLGFIFSALALFAPCYLTGKKQGFKAGIIQLISACVFLLIFWIVWLIIKALLFAPVIYGLV